MVLTSESSQQQPFRADDVIAAPDPSGYKWLMNRRERRRLKKMRKRDGRSKGRVEIPKPGGGVRKLGIPTVLDGLIPRSADNDP